MFIHSATLALRHRNNRIGFKNVVLINMKGSLAERPYNAPQRLPLCNNSLSPVIINRYQRLAMAGLFFVHNDCVTVLFGLNGTYF